MYFLYTFTLDFYTLIVSFIFMKQTMMNDLLSDLSKLELDILKQSENINQTINDLKTRITVQMDKIRFASKNNISDFKKNSFSQKINEQRKKLNKTQEQVAEKLNISLLSYKNYENEKSNIPDNKKKLIESFLFSFPTTRINNFNQSAISFLNEVYLADIPEIEPIHQLYNENRYVFTIITNIFLEAFKNKECDDNIEKERRKIYFQLQLSEALKNLNNNNFGYSLITEKNLNNKILKLSFFEHINKESLDSECIDIDEDGRPSLQIVQSDENL